MKYPVKVLCKNCGQSYISPPYSISGCRWCPICKAEHLFSGEIVIDSQVAKITRKAYNERI